MHEPRVGGGAIRLYRHFSLLLTVAWAWINHILGILRQVSQLLREEYRNNFWCNKKTVKICCLVKLPLFRLRLLLDNVLLSLTTSCDSFRDAFRATRSR